MKDRIFSRALVALCLLLILSLTMPVFAQDAAQDAAASPEEERGIEPVLIEIEAEDGQILRGAYFVPYEGDAPAVLLLHQLYSNRHSWNLLIQPLMEAGFKVLAVDLRGYGTTRGRINWDEAHNDTQVWANWLATQSGVVSVQMGGSSMGSTLALNGCAAFEGCRGVVALSPSTNYYGYSTEDAFTSGVPKLVIYAESDGYPARAMPTITEIGQSLEVWSYEGRAHGIALFRVDEELIAKIVGWYDAHR